MFDEPSTKFEDREGGERYITPERPRTGRELQEGVSDSEGKERRRQDNQHFEAREFWEENIFRTDSMESQIVEKREMEGQGSEKDSSWVLARPGIRKMGWFWRIEGDGEAGGEDVGEEKAFV